MTAYYGLSGHTLRINDINVFPVGYHPYGMDVAAGNTRLSGADILITNVDMWVCEPENFRQTLWVPWFPIDSGTINPMIRAKLPHAWERICMSKHGRELVEKLGHECDHIPCAVDMNVYHPIDRADALKEVNPHSPDKIPADPFVISMIAMNKRNPSRKANQMEEKAWDYIRKIDEMGGMIKAIERGYPRKEIADAAYRFQRQNDDKEKVTVGVNKYVTDHPPITIWRMRPEIEERQLKRLQDVRRTRNNSKVKECLGEIRKASIDGKNLMPFIINTVREYATIQEICDVWREVFGKYTDPGYF